MSDVKYEPLEFELFEMCDWGEEPRGESFVEAWDYALRAWGISKVDMVGGWTRDSYGSYEKEADRYWESHKVRLECVGLSLESVVGGWCYSYKFRAVVEEV